MMEQHRRVHSVGSNTREWLVSGPVLDARGLALVGVSHARAGFRFGTEGWTRSQILCCHAGAGKVLVNGRWVGCRRGQAYLTPAGVPHAYEAGEDGRWLVSWMTFDAPLASTPLAGLDRATLVSVDPRPIHSAIVGLYRESIAGAPVEAMSAWAELVRFYAHRLTSRAHDGARLGRVWEAVDADLCRGWTLPMLAELAMTSPEHLRRLCHRQLGRSPMQHVAYLRVRRAAQLLQTTQRKIDAIAHDVGYADRFGFSTAFERVFRQTPASFRRGA